MHVPGLVSSVSIIGLGIGLYFVFFLLYGLLFCPLRHVPGPWHTRFTSLASHIATFSGRGAKFVDELHMLYGPIVRVSPNVVGVTGQDAIRRIYGGTRPYAKDARLADLFSMCRPAHPNVAGIQDASQAMKRRRVISAAFSNKFLNDNEFIFADIARTLGTKVHKACETNNGIIDIMRAYRESATEVITEIAFGGCYSYDAGDPVELLDAALHAQFIYSLSPRLLGVMLLFPRMFPFASGCDKLADVARQSIKNYLDQPNKISGRKDCLGPMLNAKEEGSNKALPLESIVSETMVFLFAGVDSTANTATYATWEISRHPEIQEKARKEVMETFPGGFETVNLKTLQSMRYLNGCIAETLRLHAPLPGLPTRICPEPGVEFHGHLIPAGVSIGVQQWTVGHDSVKFANPAKFDPLRWDMDEITFNKEMEMMMSFSYGPRICIGKNLALSEIRHFLCLLLLNYTSITPASETTIDSMEEYEAGLTVPKSGKCVITFREGPQA